MDCPPTEVDTRSLLSLKVRKRLSKGLEKRRKLYVMDNISPGVKFMTYQPGVDVLVRAISERLYCINTPEGWIQPPVPKREEVSVHPKQTGQTSNAQMSQPPRQGVTS